MARKELIYQSYEAPVDITFTCAKCHEKKKVPVEVSFSSCFVPNKTIGELTGEVSDDRKLLPPDTPKRMLEIAKIWEKGRLWSFLGNENNPPKPDIELKCYMCNLEQLPYAGGDYNPTKAIRDRIVRKPIIIFCFVFILIWIIGLVAVYSQTPANPVFLLFSAIASAVAAVLTILYVKSAEKKVINDQTLIEKKFNCVVCDSVYADFTPYGGRVIHVNSKKST